jgi:shikimate kinase
MVGYMGSGKSSVGKELASLLGLKFIDLDTSIELLSNKKITELLIPGNETEFRKFEREALLQSANKKNVVIATGGGCPAYFDNMEWMNRNGLTIYLKAHPGTLFHRIAPEKKKRPLIAGMPDVDLMEYIMESLKKRLLYYIKAGMTVSGEPPAAIVAQQIAAVISK